MTGRPRGWRTPPVDRVMARVVVDGGGCWVFTGKPSPRGYGKVNVYATEEGDERTPRLVHRVVYEAKVGPIPVGLTLDHLCANTMCVNPAHLEPVTAAENTRRQWRDGRANAGVRQREKTHCRHGHEFSPGNTYVKPSGERCCRTCRRAQNTADRKKRAKILVADYLRVKR